MLLDVHEMMSLKNHHNAYKQKNIVNSILGKFTIYKVIVN